MLTFLLVPAAAGALLSSPQDPDDVFDGSVPVLRVDGALITADEYTRWLIETGASRFGRDFAERWVVLREAEARGVELSDRDVADHVDFQIQRRITHAFRGEKAGWLDELDRTGRTEGGYRRQQWVEQRPELTCKAMVAADRVVPEDKIVRDWELKYGPRGIDVELLMMKFQVEVLTPPSGSPPEELERNREQAFGEKKAIADEVRRRVLAGEDFGTLAARFSDDQTSREGRGRMDKPFRRGGWSHGFIDTMTALEPGELSEPEFDRGGWWLVQCVEKTVTDVEDVRQEIEAALIAKGPEQDEVGNLWTALTEDVYYELTPELFGEGSGLEGGQTIGMIVDDEEVPRATVARWLLHIRGEWQARHFAEHWLVMRKAREKGVSVSEQQVEQRTQEFLQWMLNANPSYKGSREAWKAHLMMSGRSEAHFMRELRFRMHIDLLAQELILMEREVTDEMVREEYERQFGQDGRWIEARMIQLNIAPPDLQKGMSRELVDAAIAKSVEATRTRAAQLVARLRAGEDFATLARQNSDEPISREAGGQLEGRFRPQAWSEEIADGVAGLAVGEVSGPLFDRRSCYVFEVTSARAVPFEEAAPDLRAELRDRKPASGDLAAYRNVLVKEIEYELLPGMWE
jgi:parvulin-like peptidyl-prolyl isomerase